MLYLNINFVYCTISYKRITLFDVFLNLELKFISVLIYQFNCVQFLDVKVGHNFNLDDLQGKCLF